jgi:hypothetical protein
MFCSPTLSDALPSNLKQELATQHFSGVLDGDVKLASLGTLPCGANPLHVFFYEWYESSPPGKAVHSSHRVILMDGATYVGSYVVADKPSIQGAEIRFPYGAAGRSIRCEKDGTAPKKVLLNGEIVSLEK